MSESTAYFGNENPVRISQADSSAALTSVASARSPHSVSRSGGAHFAYLPRAMRGVSGRLGLQLPPGVNPALKNAAAVIITAELPAFAKPGQRIDVTVSTMGERTLTAKARVITAA